MIVMPSFINQQENLKHEQNLTFSSRPLSSSSLCFEKQNDTLDKVEVYFHSGSMFPD